VEILDSNLDFNKKFRIRIRHNLHHAKIRIYRINPYLDIKTDLFRGRDIPLLALTIDIDIKNLICAKILNIQIFPKRFLENDY